MQSTLPPGSLFVSRVSTLPDGGADAWFHDALGLLDLPGRPGMNGTLVFRRDAGGLRAALGFDEVGTPPPDDDADARERLLRTDGVDVQHGLRLLAVIDRTIDGSDHALRTSLAERLANHDWVDETRPDLDVVIDNLSRARDGIRPFLCALDPRARIMALHPGIGAGRGIYALLDRTLDRDAPLATAMAWHPFLLAETYLFAKKDPDALRRAVAEGSGATRTAVLDHFGRTRSPEVAMAADLAERAMWDMDPDGRRAFADDVDHAGATRWHLDLRMEPVTPCLLAGDLLSSLPRAWWPKDVAAWSAMARCAPAIRFCRSRARGSVAAMLGAKGDWTAFGRRLEAAHGRGGVGLEAALSDVRDRELAYAAQVLLPAMDLHGLWSHLGPERRRRADMEEHHRDKGRFCFEVVLLSEDVARALLTSGRTVRRVLEDSRRWHAGAAGIRAAMPRTSGTGGTWPVAWPHAVVDDVRIEELTSRDALDAEASALCHCVGGYAHACRTGASRILGLRGADGAHLSTAEMAIEEGAPVVLQHRGRRNAAPPPEAVRALAAYLAGLGTSWPAVDVGALAPVEGADPYVERAGYDHRVPGTWETVRDAWDPFVPRRLRGLSSVALSRIVRSFGHADVPRWSPHLDVAAMAARPAEDQEMTP